MTSKQLFEIKEGVGFQLGMIADQKSEMEAMGEDGTCAYCQLVAMERIYRLWYDAIEG